MPNNLFSYRAGASELLHDLIVDEVDQLTYTKNGTKSDLVNSFTSTEICDQLGVTYRNLDYWLKQGTFVPSLASAHGSGSARLFSSADIRIVAIIVLLRKGNMPLATIKRSLEVLDGLDWDRVHSDGLVLCVAPDGNSEVIGLEGGFIAEYVIGLLGPVFTLVRLGTVEEMATEKVA